jgi:NTP pyrophosphatase (non-canonical NTP hydrolase)
VNTVVDYRAVVQRDILLPAEPPAARLQLSCGGIRRQQNHTTRLSDQARKNFMASTKNPTGELSIADLQRHIRQMYFDKDVARGVDGTFMWLMEEIGELASALRGTDKENLAEEFADVIAWLATIANVAEVDLNAALQSKYGQGCPGCGRLVCECPDSEKP